MELEALRKDMVAAMKAKDKVTKDAVSSLISAVKKVAKATTYAKVATKSDPLMIRNSANRSSKIIGKIPKGSKAEVIKKGSTWTKVKYKSVTGYSATRYLKF